MDQISKTWSYLNADAEVAGPEASLRNFVVDLERSGVKPKVIARALARVLLGFCAEHARRVEDFGWALLLLGNVADMMKRQSETARRIWAKRFLDETQRLYQDARFQLSSDTVPPALPPFALQASEPQGRA